MCLAVKRLPAVGLESLLDGTDLVDRLVARRLSKRPIPGHPLNWTACAMWHDRNMDLLGR
jgi:hypothetical protein